jgi:hypothetical protein
MKPLYTRPGVCKHCGGIIKRSARATQCGKCWLQAKKKRAIEYQRRKAAERLPERYCAVCGVDISNRGSKSYRCAACQKMANRAAAKERWVFYEKTPERIARAKETRRRAYLKSREKMKQIRAEFDK